MSVKNDSAKPIEQPDYSKSIRSCTSNAILKKCEGKASKFSCAFYKSEDTTHVCEHSQHTKQVGLQKSIFLKLQILPLTKGIK